MLCSQLINFSAVMYSTFLSYVWVWYKFRIIISDVCLFFSNQDTGMIKISLLFPHSQWAGFGLLLTTGAVHPRSSLHAVVSVLFSVSSQHWGHFSYSPGAWGSQLPAPVWFQPLLIVLVLIVLFRKPEDFPFFIWAWLHVHKMYKCTFYPTFLYVILREPSYVNLFHRSFINEFLFFYILILS